MGHTWSHHPLDVEVRTTTPTRDAPKRQSRRRHTQSRVARALPPSREETGRHTDPKVLSWSVSEPSGRTSGDPSESTGGPWWGSRPKVAPTCPPVRGRHTPFLFIYPRLSARVLRGASPGPEDRVRVDTWSTSKRTESADTTSGHRRHRKRSRSCAERSFCWNRYSGPKSQSVGLRLPGRGGSLVGPSGGPLKESCLSLGGSIRPQPRLNRVFGCFHVEDYPGPRTPRDSKLGVYVCHGVETPEPRVPTET